MKHVLGILLVLMAFAAAAQDMGVRFMRMEPMDLTAATSQRVDLNGTPCALVKVQMPRGAVFEGNIIGDVEYRAGEYRVYMTANSKMLRVLHESALPMMVTFAAHDVAPLQSKVTYALAITLPAAAPQAAAQQKVEIKYSPADAIVLIDGVVVNAAGGVASATLPADRDYSYTVTTRGYIPQQGTFHLHSAVPTRLNIELSPDPSATPAPQAAAPADGFSTTPVHLAVCAKAPDGRTVYIEDWRDLSGYARSSYKPLGICLSQDGETFLVELHDKEGGKEMDWNAAMKYNLPTKEQGEIIIKNKDALNSALRACGGTIMDYVYWTKTEYDSSYAWYVHMIVGTVNSISKTSSNRARAVAPVQPSSAI